MRNRYISLYFGSIRAREGIRLWWAWITAPFTTPQARRQHLAKGVQTSLGAQPAIFSYASARGALAACLRSAGIGPGDKVLLSSYTCLAVPTAVIAIGADPIYLDIDPLTLNTRAKDVMVAMMQGVSTVIVQHTLGCIAEIESIAMAAQQAGVLLIEDCALAIGSSHGGKAVGSFGDAAIYSMELSKTISCGWGGILVVNNQVLAQQVIEDYSKVPEPKLFKTAQRIWQTALSGICYEPFIFPIGRYFMAAAYRFGIFKLSTSGEEISGHPSADFIARLSGSQAVLAALQWQNLKNVAAVCERNAKWLRQAIANVGFCVLAQPEIGDVSVTPRVSFVVVNRAKLIQVFAAAEIDIGLWFDGPLSPLPQESIFNYHVGCYPNAKLVADYVVNFACHSRIEVRDLSRMVSLLEEFIQFHPAERRFSEQFVARNGKANSPKIVDYALDQSQAQLCQS